MSCPACNILKNKRMGSGKLCCNCKCLESMSSLVFDYRFKKELLILSIIYIIGMPCLFVFWACVLFATKIKFGIGECSMLVAISYWLFAMFNPNNKMVYRPWYILRSIGKTKERMFICKCASEGENKSF